MRKAGWILVAAAAMLAGPAAADPIEGTWRMPSGNNAAIAPCGPEFCLTYVNGPNKGKTFGRLKAAGAGAYAGTVTDYTRGGKEFTGKGKLEGDMLSVSGCILGGLICRSQDLRRV